MPSLSEELRLFNEAAKRPGIMGRAGWSQVVKMRSATATYFEHMATLLREPSHPEHYGELLLNVQTAIASARPLLQAAYFEHAGKAFMLSTNMSVLDVQEAAEIDLPSKKEKTDADRVIEQLDRLGFTGRQAAEYVTLHGAQMIKGIDEESIKIVNEIIAKGIAEQLGTQGTVKLLRAQFKDWTRVRARAVARTEIADAMEEATFQKMKSIGTLYKRWIHSPGACPICVANSSQGAIPINDDFQSGHPRPPAHPSDRCAVVGVRESEKDRYGEGYVQKTRA